MPRPVRPIAIEVRGSANIRRLSRLALLLMGCIACSPRQKKPPPSLAQASTENENYWYLDIKKKFFKEQPGADGRTVMAAQRPRSKAASFPKRKEPSALRVFILGGSVAAQFDSDSDDQTYAARFDSFRSVLSGLFPERKPEVINCGMGAYDSYRESLILDEIVGYDPDLIVLMTGGNDATATAGPPSFKELATLRLRRLFKFIPGLASHLKIAAHTPEPAGSFARRLRGMIRLAKRKGAVVVVCTLPHRLGLPPPEPLPWDHPLFSRAWTALEKGRGKIAVELFRLSAKLHPSEGLWLIYLGRTLERLGDMKGARGSYRRAEDDDPPANKVILRVGSEEGAIVADLRAVFDLAGRGARNEELMADDVHWNRTSDPLASATIAQAILRDGPKKLPPSLAQKLDATKIKSLMPRWERLAAQGPPRSPERYRSQVLKALWESLLTQPGFSEKAVSLFESLDRNYPEELARLAGQKEALRAAVEANAWVREQSGDFDRRWMAGLACLAETYRRRGKPVLAGEYFAAALQHAPDAPGPHPRDGDVWFWINEILEARSSGDRNSAKTLLSLVLNNFDFSSGTKRFLTDALKDEANGPALSRVARRWRYLRGGEADRPRDAGLLTDLADVYKRLGRTDRSKSLLAEMERLGGDEPSLRHAVQVWRDLRDDAASKRVLEKLLRLVPRDVAILLDLAELEVRLGNAREAGRRCDEAERLSGDAPSLRRVARIWRELSEHAASRRALGKLRRLEPRNAGVLVDLARESADMAERGESLALLARARALEPADNDAHRIALVYTALREHRPCLDIMRGLVERHSNSAAYRTDKAVCEYQLGMTEEAIKDLKKALELDESFLPASLSLGSIRARRK